MAAWATRRARGTATSRSLRYDRLVTVQERLHDCGVVPVVQPPERTRAAEMGFALVEAGLPCVEVTFRAAIDAGAHFLVAPGTGPDVVELAMREGIPIVPGVATPTEIEANLARGLEVMKLFPAEVLGGVRFLKAVYAPYRMVRFMPTGGVDPTNLADYLAQPNVIACGGTWIAPPAVVAAADFESMAQRAREAVAIVRSSRAEVAAR
jgi:2-dehydro-3-deoxyphosphogluconate aldolase/(4S)-4-hydroxy-2-oxoglutarate aldolase